MANRLAQPLQVDNLRHLKETIPDDKFRIFQSAVKADFVAPQNVSRLTQRLDSFDKATLDLLFDKGEQRALRSVGQRIDRLNTLGIKDVLERQTQNASVVRELVDRRDTASIDLLVESVKQNQPLKKSLRAGIMEDIYTKSVSNQEGALILDRKILVDEIKDLQDSGAIRLLDPDDIRVLKNLDTVVEFLTALPDSGTSLQAASAAAGVRSLDRQSILTILENITIGRLFTSKVGQRIFLGSGVEKFPFAKTRVLGAVLANVLTDVENETAQPDQP